MTPPVSAADVVDAYGRGELSPQQAMYLILCARLRELYFDQLPNDPFDISGWMDVLTPEQRNALEALCSR